MVPGMSPVIEGRAIESDISVDMIPRDMLTLDWLATDDEVPRRCGFFALPFPPTKKASPSPFFCNGTHPVPR